MKNFRQQVLDSKFSSTERKVNYDLYRMSLKEEILYTSKGIAILLLFGYFFYRSFWMSALLSPLLYFYRKEVMKELIKKRKEELNIQFRDAILAVTTGLQAGYSIENAFVESYQDLLVLYGKDSLIAKEWSQLMRGFHNNVTLESQLLDFGNRSKVEDILDFANIMSIAKRLGGNLNEIIRTTATLIDEKVQVMTEIQTIISAKKFEQQIMNMVPFGILFYIESTSKGFFAPLYHNLAGNIIMTICLCLYLLAYMLSKKIVNIEV